MDARVPMVVKVGEIIVIWVNRGRRLVLVRWMIMARKTSRQQMTIEGLVEFWDWFTNFPRLRRRVGVQV